MSEQQNEMHKLHDGQNRFHSLIDNLSVVVDKLHQRNPSDELINEIYPIINVLQKSQVGKVQLIRHNRGKNKGKFDIRLKGDNGRVLVTTRQAYSNRQDVIDMANKYFPTFPVQDLTKI